nr:VanZ family protein [uncultured Aminipila sp.]
MAYIVAMKGYILPGLIASVIVLLISEINLKRRHEHVAAIHRGLLICLGLYLTIVFSVTISPDMGVSISSVGKNINLNPFMVLNNIATNPMNFFGNMLMFVPLGILLVLLSYKCQKLHVTLLIGMGISLLIEFIQLFESRSTDVDDVILNTIGTFAGYIVGKLILLFIPSLRRRVGVIRKIEGKYRRRLNDTGIITALCFVIAISVFTAGFAQRGNVVETNQIHDRIFEKEAAEKVKNADEMISADLIAKNAYFIDVSSNTVYYQKESEQKIAPASTTKMLTALTTLDYCDMDEEVRVGEEVKLIADNASRAWLYAGNELTVQQLLDGLLLPSGNDAAYAIGVFTGRKIAEDENLSIDEALSVFMTAMNNKAKSIGAKNSNFTSPDGYDSENQYTTAQDLAFIAKKFLECNKLKRIVSSHSISDKWLSGQKVTYHNTNELINPESPYYYEQAIGLKTGKSESAGCCLVSAAKVQGHIYIGVVMGSTEEGRWEDSLGLYNEIEERKAR